MPMAPTPRRPGAPLETSSRKEQCTSRDPDETSAEYPLGEVNTSAWMCIKPIANAFANALLRRSSSARLHADNAGAHLTHKIFDTKPLRHLGPKTAYGRKAAVDPVSIALYEAGALHADPMECWMMNGSGQ